MNTPSLRLRPLAAAILCSLLAPALFAQTATTTPVGFITRTIPVAVDANTPSNTTISVPLYATPDYVSTVASLDSATQFTMTGAAWTPGAYATTAAPRLVRVKASTAVPANIGKYFLVSGNTANQLTVTLPVNVGNVNTAISVGDSCEVVPANTLGSVFGTAATTPPQLKAGLTTDDADDVLIWDGTTFVTYFWTGNVGSPANIWKKTGNLDKSGTVIYPDEAVFVIHRDTAAAVTLTLMGTVPSTAEQTVIAASGSTFISNRFPVDVTLGTVAVPTMPALNLQNIAGWIGGATSDVADNVFIWNAGLGTWDTYFWTGSGGIWKKTGNLDRSNTVIPAGTGIFISHGASALTLSQALPYTP